MKTLSFVCIAVVLFAVAACGNAKPPCQTNSDCGNNSVCLALGSDKACAPTCTASANECGAESSCGGVGVLSVNVCQPPKATPTADAPPKPAEEPSIPCNSDDECAALQPGAICAQYKGAKDCTLPCTQESQCNLPSLGGVSIDFLACNTDESNTSRKACLPDEKCFANPLSCVTFPGLPGGGGLPGDDFDAGFP